MAMAHHALHIGHGPESAECAKTHFFIFIMQKHAYELVFWTRRFWFYCWCPVGHTHTSTSTYIHRHREQAKHHKSIAIVCGVTMNVHGNRFE